MQIQKDAGSFDQFSIAGRMVARGPFVAGRIWLHVVRDLVYEVRRNVGIACRIRLDERSFAEAINGSGIAMRVEAQGGNRIFAKYGCGIAVLLYQA